MKNPKTWDELSDEQKKKIYFICTDDIFNAPEEEPTEAELKAWYEGEPDAFDFDFKLPLDI